MDAVKMKIVYVVTPRGGKNYWNRVGVAFVNRDGSLNVKLEAVPVNGEIHIRDYVPRDEALGTNVAKEEPFVGTSLVEHGNNGNGRSSPSESDAFASEFS